MNSILNMTLANKISSLGRLGNWIKERNPELQDAVTETYRHNRWFVEANSYQALDGIATSFLDTIKLNAWVKKEDVGQPQEIKKVGLILAGNIPLVGFHDWLAVVISGHIPIVKLSDKDRFLLPLLNKYLKEIGFDSQTQFVDRLEGFDGVIATGSNNTSRYFESYFGKYPHIIRKNRNGIAVLDGSETKEDLEALGADVFNYFGLGCRSTSKLYVPEGYSFDFLFSSFQAFDQIVHHNKYKNNFDYNYTLIIMNKSPHQSNGITLLLEDKSLTSRIATLHYEYYQDIDVLQKELIHLKDSIQCVGTKLKLDGLPTLPFGAAQNPNLEDYADGVNTLQFLNQL